MTQLRSVAPSFSAGSVSVTRFGGGEDLQDSSVFGEVAQRVRLPIALDKYVEQSRALRIQSSSTTRISGMRRLTGPRELLRLMDQISYLKDKHDLSRDLASAIRDAWEFVGALPFNIPLPKIWTDGECEVGIEWIYGDRHAIVTVEGIGLIGYAYLVSGKFRPGQVIEAPCNAVPGDLITYLKEM